MGSALNHMHTDIKEARSDSKKQFHFGWMLAGNNVEVLHKVLMLHKDFVDEWQTQVPALEME